MTDLFDKFIAFITFAGLRANIRAEKEANRRHQLQMVEALIEGLNVQQRAQADSVMALAKAQEKQSEAFGEWLKLFTHAPAPVKDDPQATELLQEMERFKALKEAGVPVSLPPEFALAYALKFHEGL